jgi:thioredoxin-dependent peroxiredoxin
MVKENDDAPNFTLQDANSKPHSLLDYRGKKVVLYFYPKDDTPGCTKEACDFRDSLPDFSKKNAVIIGISSDNPKSHAQFKEKYGLPFTLLADPNKKVIELYGSWGQKNLYGKLFMGLIRSTFLINEEGKIVKVWRNVRVKNHVSKVLELI